MRRRNYHGRMTKSSACLLPSRLHCLDGVAVTFWSSSVAPAADRLAPCLMEVRCLSFPLKEIYVKKIAHLEATLRQIGSENFW